MLIRLAVFLLESSPWLRRFLWRWWYGRLAKRYTAGDWTFMNYGHVPPTGEPTLALNPQDEADRLCIQLYHRVASAAPLADKDVLEVGRGLVDRRSHQARARVGHDDVQVPVSLDHVLDEALCRARNCKVRRKHFGLA